MMVKIYMLYEFIIRFFDFFRLYFDDAFFQPELGWSV